MNVENITYTVRRGSGKPYDPPDVEMTRFALAFTADDKEFTIQQFVHPAEIQASGVEIMAHVKRQLFSDLGAKLAELYE